MNYSENSLLERAIQLATQAHEGQVDKAGKPYIGHPLRVMNNLTTLEEKIVGVLHDTIEDTNLTLHQLSQQGFSTEIIAAVEAITKRHGEDYETYLQRVLKNAIALKVKIADMSDNLDETRIAKPTERDEQRWEKYKAILPRLLAAVS